MFFHNARYNPGTVSLEDAALFFGGRSRDNSPFPLTFSNFPSSVVVIYPGKFISRNQRKIQIRGDKFGHALNPKVHGTPGESHPGKFPLAFFLPFEKLHFCSRRFSFRTLVSFVSGLSFSWTLTCSCTPALNIFRRSVRIRMYKIVVWRSQSVCRFLDFSSSVQKGGKYLCFLTNFLVYV